MTSAEPATAAAAFLRAILPSRVEGEVYRVEVLPPVKQNSKNYLDVDVMAQHLVEHGEKRNAYVALATFPAKGTDRRAEHALRFAVVWADLDVGAKKPFATKEDAVAVLAKFELAPSVIVDSGHGIHAYWRLGQPVGPEDHDVLIGTVKGLAAQLGGDPAATLVTQIMRVPGTMNVDSFEKRKDGRDHLVTLLESNDYEYSLDSFTDAGIVPVTERREVPQVLGGDQHIKEGTRNSTLASAGGAMRRFGLSQRAIESALLIHNEEYCDPPLGDGEVEGIAKSVARYRPGDATNYLISSQPGGLAPDFPLEAVALLGVLFLITQPTVRRMPSVSEAA